MSYLTPAEFAGSAAWLNELDPAETVEILARASRQVDRILNRPGGSLELKTVTNRRWQILVPNWDATRVLHVPDWPPVEPDLWTFTLTALLLRDGEYDLRHTVTVGDVVAIPADRGVLILPDGVAVGHGWWAVASYVCGYTTVPDVIQEATLCVAKSMVQARLGQTGGFEAWSESGVLKARAEEMLVPYVTVGVG